MKVEKLPVKHYLAEVLSFLRNGKQKFSGDEQYFSMNNFLY